MNENHRLADQMDRILKLISFNKITVEVIKS